MPARGVMCDASERRHLRCQREAASGKRHVYMMRIFATVRILFTMTRWSGPIWLSYRAGIDEFREWRHYRTKPARHYIPGVVMRRCLRGGEPEMDGDLWNERVGFGVRWRVGWGWSVDVEWKMGWWNRSVDAAMNRFNIIPMEAENHRGC